MENSDERKHQTFVGRSIFIGCDLLECMGYRISTKRQRTIIRANHHTGNQNAVCTMKWIYHKYMIACPVTISPWMMYKIFGIEIYRRKLTLEQMREKLYENSP